MSINSSDFDLNRNARLPNNRKLSKAGVLVGICFPQQGEPSVLLTKRASHLTNHPGQVAFPGGKFELQDSTLTNTALREAEEEIGLDRSIPQKLGALPNHETITRFLVTPVMFKLPDKLYLKINLIPFNEWPGSPYKRSDWSQIKKFADIIHRAGYASPVRTPRGEDIMAACGQLKSETERQRKSRKEITLETGI